MIDDVFVENFVKREKSVYTTLFKVFSIMATAILILAIFLIPIFLGINVLFVSAVASFAVGFACYYLNTRQNIEFETSLTNDDFTFTKIINENKRELLTSFNLKECNRIAPVTADSFEQDKKDSSLVINATRYSELKKEDSNWYCFVESDGMKYMVIFEFNERMYKAFRRYNPRNTHFMRITAKKDEE